jgi:hypothetical protein
MSVTTKGAIWLNFAGIMLASSLFVGADYRSVAVAEEPALVRVTSSFELKHAGAVLRQVSKLFSGGFARGDADTLAHNIDALKADQPQAWRYTVTYQGAGYPLEVRARLDDLGMLDLDFSTTAALAPAVRKAVDGYLNARGL